MIDEYLCDFEDHTDPQGFLLILKEDSKLVLLERTGVCRDTAVWARSEMWESLRPTGFSLSQVFE